MENRFKKLKINSFVAICYQILLIACGLLLPRCYLRFYGSETNGLLSSIAQFLSFINICDLGISAVVASAYYEPLAENNTVQISRIFNYSKHFFRKICYILLGYLLILLFLFPSLLSDQFSPFFTACLILSMCVSYFAQYFIGNTYQVLLNADQKSYIQLGINGITLFLSTLLSVILMVTGCSIQIVKLVSAIIYLFRPIGMMLYVKSHYTIDYHLHASPDVIPHKNSGIIQHLAYMIYENTDIAVLTIASSLSNVSIYSVYALILGSIRNIITSSITGFQALFGNIIAKNESDLLQSSFSFYNWLINSLCSFFFTITGILILPFVKIYTANINDAQYSVPLFAFILTLAYGIACVRNGLFNLIRAAGHYRQTQSASLIEAFLNLGLSVFLVIRFGLVGVALGTLLSAIYFTIFETVYLSRHIVKWPIKNFLKQYGINLSSILAMLSLSLWVPVSSHNIFLWIISAMQVSVLCFLGFLLVQLAFRFNETKTLFLSLVSRFYSKKKK